MRLDLDGLEALDAVVRCGGFARAADGLHKVQSAISYQVRKLERQLGVPILNRSGYRVELTAAGEAILAEGRRLLAEARHVEVAGAATRRGLGGAAAGDRRRHPPTEPTLAAFKTLA